MKNPVRRLLKKFVTKWERISLPTKKFRVDAEFIFPPMAKEIFTKTLQMNGGKQLFEGTDYGVPEIQKLLKLKDTEALLVIMIGTELKCWKS